MGSRAPSKQIAPPPKSLQVFIAGGGCNNCKRFVESLRNIPALHPVTTVIDVQKTPYSGVDVVPTIVVNGRQKLVGSAAFEFLRDYDSVLEPPAGSTDLHFSLLGEEDSGTNNSSWFGEY
jgi:hypothetical protein